MNNVEKNNAVKDSQLEWKLTNDEHLTDDDKMQFRRQAYQLPDGKVLEPYYTYSVKSYVVIVASDEQGRFLTVRQYRAGIREVTNEFPAGGIENSYKCAEGKAMEDPLEAAKRELLEETGCVSDDWTPLIKVPSNATRADNYAWLYRAKNCRRVSGQHLDDTEFLNVIPRSAGEIEELIAQEQFQQAIHILAWQLTKK